MLWVKRQKEHIKFLKKSGGGKMNKSTENKKQEKLSQWSTMAWECKEIGLSVRTYCVEKGIGVKITITG